MKQALTFDDVLIVPKFSYIESRKDVNLSFSFQGMELKLPIISSNMDTVTGSDMASTMLVNGATACLHRFQTIEENVSQFKAALEASHGDEYISRPMVSVGLGFTELERAKALREVGARHFVIDVAHGATMSVVNQYKQLRDILGNDVYITVGNFATASTIIEFNNHCHGYKLPDSFKISVGGGSACLTRVVTGCGMPTFETIIDCKKAGVPLIADGGIRTSGDIAKALAAGADMVMLGGMLAGTKETPGEVVHSGGNSVKKYRGSASQESYEVQGKTAQHRSYEGDSFMVPFKGSVTTVLQQIEGGLRSAFTYVGANDVMEFKANSEFIQVTNSGVIENGSHGKN